VAAAAPATSATTAAPAALATAAPAALTEQRALSQLLANGASKVSREQAAWCDSSSAAAAACGVAGSPEADINTVRDSSSGSKS
jgi:hypothetical protein